MIITLVVALVVAVVGIGVMGLTTNDTDESIQAEVSASPELAGRAIVADANGQTSIHVLVGCPQSNCRGRVIPMWDAWNQNVADDYTRERDFKHGDAFNLSVTTKGFCVHSQMHWRFELTSNPGYADVELHEDACSGFVHAEPGGRTATHFGCSQGKFGAAYMECTSN